MRIPTFFPVQNWGAHNNRDKLLIDYKLALWIKKSSRILSIPGIKKAGANMVFPLQCHRLACAYAV
jgi:hypothetical protein